MPKSLKFFIHQNAFQKEQKIARERKCMNEMKEKNCHVVTVTLCVSFSLLIALSNQLDCFSRALVRNSHPAMSFEGKVIK
jgi:hypothetical protein